jgi:hypothetical protein
MLNIIFTAYNNNTAKNRDDHFFPTLHRHNTENSKQIFPEKELRSLSTNFHIHVFVSDIFITTISLPILLQENIWTDTENI